MKISGGRATSILLLVIYCLWCNVQPTAGGKCSGQWAIHACAGGNGKRSDVGDVAQLIGLERTGQGPDMDEGRGGERTGGGGRGGGGGERTGGGGERTGGGERGGGGGGGERTGGGGGERTGGGGGGERTGEGGRGRESNEFRGVREDADLRSELNDREQLLEEERQLLNNDNRRPRRPPLAPLDSALGRLRSLLRTTRVGDDEGADEQREEEEPPKRISTDTNSRYMNRDTLLLLRKILNDIERRLDSQGSHDRAPDSVKKEQGYVADEDSYSSLQKRAAEQ